MIRKRSMSIKTAHSRKDRLAHWHYCVRNWVFGSAAQCKICRENEAKKT